MQLSSCCPRVVGLVAISAMCLWAVLMVGQIGKILGERWKNMTEKDKAVYEAKATKDKERYEAEKRAYNVSPLSPSPPIPPITPPITPTIPSQPY